MGRRLVIPFNIDAPAGDDSKHELWEVEYSKVRTKEIEIIPESGTRGVLFMSLYYGDMKVSPAEGEWTSDGTKLKDYPDVPYFRGDKILMRVRNTDTANPHFVYGTLEVEVEEE